MRNAREARRWSQRDVYAMTGIAPLKVHLIEAGTATLTTAIATRLVDLYELDATTTKAVMTAATADERAAAWLIPTPGPLTPWESLDLLHLVTTGRRTGRRLTRPWPLFAVDASQVLLLAPAEPADWIANIKADPDIGIGPPGVPRPGRAHEAVEGTEDNLRRRMLVWNRLGRPGELADGRLVVVDVDPEGSIVGW